jgi:PqqD family protein of HPr-rel-A system
MVPRHVDNLPWRSIGDRCVVINPRRGEVHELDEVGSFLWKAADGAQSLNQICVRLSDEFEVEPLQAESDASEFFRQLEALGLLECRS